MLIENWRKAWRFFSIHAMVASIAVQAAWDGFPDAYREALPAWVAPAISIGLLVLGIVGRLVQQDNT